MITNILLLQKIKTLKIKVFRYVTLIQYCGGDGEIGASLRYLSQRFSMITPQAQATLNDIGTEEYEPFNYH